MRSTATANPSARTASVPAATAPAGSRRPVWPQRLLLLGLFGLLTAQAVLWTGQLARIQPRLDIVPPAPSAIALHAAALGDHQALFRWRALELQAFGDSGGRVTPLNQLDYDELVRWFDALDSLDPRAAHVPTLAAFVFGQTRDPAQLRLVADYLRRHARHDLARQYRWNAHAATLAAHRLGDRALAFEILSELGALPAQDLPIWVRLMPAFLYTQLGETEAATDLLRAILVSGEDLPATEQRYLHWQIERLQSAGTPPEKAQP